MSFRAHFSRFLDADPSRLHAAAHSHHPWPDVTFVAQQQAWADAARLHDDKWDVVFGEVLPQMQRHIARRLNLPDPATIAVAPNTHELVARVVSALPSPASVLTTDAEFHSFSRQVARWEEAGRVIVERVASAPLSTFVERLRDAVTRGGHDLVFFSQVLFDSGYVIEDLASVIAAVPDDDTTILVDGYHAFMAVPVDLSAVADRIFYTAGGYKYAMAGEGACFLHCPPGRIPRPVNTGWLAGFGELVMGPGETVGYPTDGARFLGATFDPTAMYRFNAVQEWLDDENMDVAAIHHHVVARQDELLAMLGTQLPAPSANPRGHFLSFQLPDAGHVYRRLHVAGVITDFRGDRLRIGLGLYHDAGDIKRLGEAITEALDRRSSD